MKSTRALIVLLSSLILISTSPAIAEEVVPTRAEQVAQIHAKYDPLYDAQYARLMIVKSKITNNASMLPSFKLVMVDFLGVRKFLDTSLSSSTSDLETIIVMPKKSSESSPKRFIYWKPRYQRARPSPVLKVRR